MVTRGRSTDCLQRSEYTDNIVVKNCLKHEKRYNM